MQCFVTLNQIFNFNSKPPNSEKHYSVYISTKNVVETMCKLSVTRSISPTVTRSLM